MQSTETESLAYAAQPDSDHHVVLTIVDHPEPTLLGLRQVLPDGDAALLGRSPEAYFPGGFDMRSISRRHAELSCLGERLELRDLGSHNGTLVNGERIDKKVVQPGDAVRVGDVLLLVHRGPLTYRKPDHPTLLGASAAIATLLQQIAAAAPGDENVMIIGETGSGKELVARAVHEQSERRGPFAAINCGGLADGVVHSELFGHVKGAYSSADAPRAGLVAEARAGSLFLDELASAPPQLQSALLRLLETGEYRPVGGDAPRQADVRFIAALQPPAGPETSGLRRRSVVPHGAPSRGRARAAPAARGHHAVGAPLRHRVRQPPRRVLATDDAGDVAPSLAWQCARADRRRRASRGRGRG